MQYKWLGHMASRHIEKSDKHCITRKKWETTTKQHLEKEISSRKCGLQVLGRWRDEDTSGIWPTIQKV